MEAHRFFEKRIHNPRNYVSSLGFDERMFITIKIRGQKVEALFDPGSCRTYLGGPVLEKFPGMLRQAKKGTKAKVVYPNGNVDETGGSLLVCMGIEGVNDERPGTRIRTFSKGALVTSVKISTSDIAGRASHRCERSSPN